MRISREAGSVQGTADRTPLGCGTRCRSRYPSAFHGELLHLPTEREPRQATVRCSLASRGPRRSTEGSGLRRPIREVPTPCFTANAAIGPTVERSSAQACIRPHGMRTRSDEPKAGRFIEARRSRNRGRTASPSQPAVPRETSKAEFRQRTCGCSTAVGRTRHTVVASGFARRADVSRETRSRATTRPLLMRVAPRTHCDRESERVLPGSVLILLDPPREGGTSLFHVDH